MLRALRIGFFCFLALLGLALVWRAFFHTMSPVTAAPEIPAPGPAPQISNQNDLILDLFNPNDTALAGQLSESALKRQIEEAMTVSFVLRRCDRMNEDEYNDTYRALLTYIQRLHPQMTSAQAAAMLQQNASSASASYSLIYARSACDQPQLKTAQSQLAGWRKTILSPKPQ